MSFYLFIIGLLSLVYLHKFVYQCGETFVFLIAPDITVEYKRKYIIKNIWKSFILVIIFIGSIVTFIDCFYNNIWTNLHYHLYGLLYVSLDVSGLYYVRGLPRETVIHHCVVLCLGSLNSIVDYMHSGYARSVIIYTFFSVVPCIVNFYLGYRYLEKNTRRLHKVCYLSYWIYKISLVLNVLCQVIFFVKEPFHWSIILYMGAYTLVIMDDVKLIHFLKRELIHYNSIIAKKTDVPVPVGVDLDNDELD
jgi:hypothetical protein